MAAAITPEITLRNAIPEDALCIGVLGMQVFLDTYATQGIRSSIANEALQAFAPQTIAQLMAQWLSRTAISWALLRSNSPPAIR